jgi:DeoR/GlpR family transcriptional regulator of sugar metabolism
MAVDERRRQLAEALAGRGFAELSVLAAELDVSESTVRRDLAQLEEEGTVRRTHGGAVFVSDRFSALNYAAREAIELPEKQAIGKVVADLIHDGQAVLIDGGTTTFQVARRLMARTLQVVTNSLPIVNALSSAANVELIFLGGYIYPRTGVALGPLTSQALGSLHVRQAIISVAGITQEGFYNANMLLVEAEQRMMNSAAEVIVAADHTKFGRTGLGYLTGWDRVDRVVSDEGLDPHWQQVVRDSGAELILAPLDVPGGEGLVGSRDNGEQNAPSLLSRSPASGRSA